MAKSVTRQNLKQFGVNGNSNNFGQFGSVNNGTPIKTKAIATIQALSAWLNGWQDAVVSGNKAPFLEDMNGAMFVAFYELFYLLQEGIAEWDGSTTYFIGSLARRPETSQLYISLTDNNVGNALPAPDPYTDNANWSLMWPVRFSQMNVDQLVTSQITDHAVTTAKIALLNITTALIADLGVTDAKILSMDGGKISGANSVLRNKLQSVVFSADESSSGANVTGDGTVWDVAPYQTEQINNTGSFNSTTGVFTAPVAGNYLLTGRLKFGNNTNATLVSMALKINSVTSALYTQAFYGKTVSPFAGFQYLPFSFIVPLAANDTVSLVAVAYGTTKVINVQALFQGNLT